MSEEAKLLRELAGIARQSDLHKLRVGFTPDEAERIAAHIELIERERNAFRAIARARRCPVCDQPIAEWAAAYERRIAELENELARRKP